MESLGLTEGQVQRLVDQMDLTSGTTPDLADMMDFFEECATSTRLTSGRLIAAGASGSKPTGDHLQAQRLVGALEDRQHRASTNSRLTGNSSA